MKGGNGRSLHTVVPAARDSSQSDTRLHFEGPFNFDIHPTNVGHNFIAQQFQDAWLMLQ